MSETIGSAPTAVTSTYSSDASTERPSASIETRVPSHEYEVRPEVEQPSETESFGIENPEETGDNIISFLSETQSIPATFQELADNGFQNINKPDETEDTDIEARHESDRARFAERGVLFDNSEDETASDEVNNNPLYKQKMGEVLAEQDPEEPIDLEKVKKEALTRYQEELDKIHEKPLDLRKLDSAAAERVQMLESQVEQQQQQLEKMGNNWERTQEQLQQLSIITAELALLIAQMNAAEDEEEKKNLAEQIFSLVQEMVTALMTGLVDPDKVGKEGSQQTKEVEKPTKKASKKEVQELMKEKIAAYRELTKPQQTDQPVSATEAT